MGTTVTPRMGCVLVTAVVLVISTARPEPAVDELRASRRADTLLVDLSASDLLDERTLLTVDSGLPGTCVFALRLEDSNETVIQRQIVHRTLRLDLWENHYVLSLGGEEHRFQTLAAADSAMSRLVDHPLVVLSRLGSNTGYRVVVDVAVQPLAPEDRERLSRYVSRNSTAEQEEFALDIGSVFSGLFGRRPKREETLRRETPFFRVDELEVKP